MQSLVLVPMQRFGASKGMLGRSDAVPARASSETAAPGNMAPPNRRALASMTKMVVAVPRSAMMTGGVRPFTAATALATRSAPSVDGSSMPMFLSLIHI